MKTRLLKLTFLLFSLVAVLASCNKTTDVTPQFLRGGNSLVLADNGNLVIAGYASTSSNGYDATLVMTTDGNSDSSLWKWTYGSSYSDAFYSVKKANKGGFIAAGFSNKSNASSPAMLVVITDANGKMVKSKTYGGSAYSQGLNVVSVNDTSYLVAGYIQKTNRPDRDLYLVKINNAGDTLWTKNYGAKGRDVYDTCNDAAYGVIKAPDGGFYLTGNLNGYSNSGGRIFLMKVSSKGDSLWTRTYNFGIGYSLTLTRDNGIAISGSLQEGSSQDIILLKTDTAGKVLWKQTYGGTGFEYGATMIETTDGGFAITGITDSKGNGLQDVCLILANSSGVATSWEQTKTYGAADNDQGFGLVEMPDKGFCITGLSNSGGSYIFLNRTSSDGTQGWVKYIE
jgi:hypothetical protein